MRREIIRERTNGKEEGEEGKDIKEHRVNVCVYICVYMCMYVCVYICVYMYEIE